MISLILTILQLLSPIFINLIAKYFEKTGADQKDWEFLTQFTQVMRERQLLSVKFRLKAEDQLDEIDKRIDDVQNPKPKESKP